MSSRRICAPATDRWRFLRHIILLGYAFIVSAPSMAAESVTMLMETEVLDLDAGTIVAALTEDLMAPAGADVLLAYNANRSPHAVVFPMGEAVGLAFVANVGFDGVSSSDIPNLVFSSEPIDLPFSASDCVVIRTDQGAVFKLGNASEANSGVTFNFAAL